MKELSFVHQFVAAAPSASSRALLLLHGTGGDEEQLLGLGRELDPEAALLSPRGKVLENGAPRFFRRFAEGVFDEADIIARAKELANFIDEATAHYGIDIGKLSAIGYSNGANIAAAVMLLGLARFPKAILLRPMVPLAPATPLDLSRARLLLMGGEFDPIARPPIVKQLAELLHGAGASVTLEFQSSGHELTPADVAKGRQWLIDTR